MRVKNRTPARVRRVAGTVLFLVCVTSEADGQDATPVEEIVVSARRRPELLEKTPISITVLSESLLAETTTTRLDQTQFLVPNLSAFRTGDGQTGVFVIRGIGNFPLVGLDPGVGVYVDGVYLPRGPGTIIDVVDVAQIEVLRGPQGTLFGKNTVGGAINVTSVAPGPDLEAYALVRTGSFGTIDTRISLNLPVREGWFEDRLAVRLAFASFQNRGYTFDTYRGEYASDRNSLNFLGTARLALPGDIELSVTGAWAGSNTRGRGGECVYVTTPQVLWPPEGYVDSCRASGPRFFEADTHQISALESYGIWGIARWDAPRPPGVDSLVVKLISSWREQIPRTRVDDDLTRFFLIQTSNVGGGAPLDGSPGRQQQIQQELQINASAFDERLDVVGGAFGFWEDLSQSRGVYFEGLHNEVRATAARNQDWALYLQATADLTSWLTATAGVRYTEETKRLSRRKTYLPTGEVTEDVSEKVTFDAWSPTATLAAAAPESWLSRVSLDSLLGYFTYSQGFQGGGLNTSGGDADGLLAFDPQFVDSYEVGVKATGLDRSVTVNVSLFLAEIRDQQVQQPALAGFTTENAARSESKGFELEVASDLGGLAVTGSVGYVDAKFEEFEDALSYVKFSSTDRSGQSFPFIPKWQTHMGVQYSLPVRVSSSAPWLEGFLSPRLDWAWRSNVTNWGPEVPAARQESFHLVNLRVGYGFNRGRSEIAFLGRNLTGSRYFIDSLSQVTLAGTVFRYFEAPRFFGAELSHRFGGPPR